MINDNCCKFKVSKQNIYKQLSLCSPRVKLLKFSIWQMISASFLMRSRRKNMLSAPEDGKKHRHKPNRMSDAEIIVILILFHSGGFRCFKHYYLHYSCKHCKHMFPNTVSYNRFIELQKEILLQLTVFIKQVLLGECTGISLVDSTPLRVCRNQRIHMHKTFQGLASRGKCSMGWFFGFKLHLIINNKGEILNFMFITGNVDDREPLKDGVLLKNIKGARIS